MKSAFGEVLRLHGRTSCNGLGPGVTGCSFSQETTVLGNAPALYVPPPEAPPHCLHHFASKLELEQTSFQRENRTFYNLPFFVSHLALAQSLSEQGRSCQGAWLQARRGDLSYVYTDLPWPLRALGPHWVVGICLLPGILSFPAHPLLPHVITACFG